LFVFVEDNSVAGYISYSSNLFYNRPYIAFLFVTESHRQSRTAAVTSRTT